MSLNNLYDFSLLSIYQFIPFIYIFFFIYKAIVKSFFLHKQEKLHIYSLHYWLNAKNCDWTVFCWIYMPFWTPLVVSVAEFCCSFLSLSVFLATWNQFILLDTCQNTFSNLPCLLSWLQLLWPFNCCDNGLLPWKVSVFQDKWRHFLDCFAYQWSENIFFGFSHPLKDWYFKRMYFDDCQVDCGKFSTAYWDCRCGFFVRGFLWFGPGGLRAFMSYNWDPCW